jgi:hypothetical protein
MHFSSSFANRASFKFSVFITFSNLATMRACFRTSQLASGSSNSLIEESVVVSAAQMTAQINTAGHK